MLRIMLCPNCRSIQKAGVNCSICKCPVHSPSPEPKQEPEPELELVAAVPTRRSAFRPHR